MSHRLFEYAVIKQEKRDGKGNVTDAATVLVEPTTVLSTDETKVGMLAARAIPESELDNLDRITVVVRPF